jgi:FRG domain
MEVELSSWKYFHDYVRQEMLDFSSYIWRGQRDAQWALASSLDRTLSGLSAERREGGAAAHLRRFQQSTRGRRGPNPVRIEDEGEWWALGQHHGLVTPLLDWTESPFVALYFAFEKPQRPPSGIRSVWALAGGFSTQNIAILNAHTGSGPPPTIEFVRPQADENARLVAQAGLFTKVPLAMTVDDWVRTNFAGVDNAVPLLKLTLPEIGRSECLRTLNKMNINHLSLFPDLYGSGHHCNKYLEITSY